MSSMRSLLPFLVLACAVGTLSQLASAQSNCSVSTGSLKTFDGTMVKYKPCHHILARSINTSDLSIEAHRTCWNDTNCLQSLTLKNAQQTIEFYDDGVNYSGRILSYDDFFAQTKGLTKVANVTRGPGPRVIIIIIIIVYVPGMRISYDSEGTIDIMAPKISSGRIFGLCGLFNGKSTDDLTLPTGKITTDVTVFGNAWLVPGYTLPCLPIGCDAKNYELATNICAKISLTAPLSKCPNLRKLMLRCSETVCKCLAQQSTEKCLCQAAELWSRECCGGFNGSIDGWRNAFKCPLPICPTGLTYQDSFQRPCDPSCKDILIKPEPCPVLAGKCFPGCHCPEGLYREGDRCIPPSECFPKNCTCHFSGDPHVMPFEYGNYFTYQGVGTYVAVDHASFKILVHSDICGSGGVTCVDAVTIKYNGDSATLKRIPGTLQAIVNGVNVPSFPFINSWVRIEGSGNVLTLKVSSLWVVMTMSLDWNLLITMPSNLKPTQGLCGDIGNCSVRKDREFSFTTRDGKIVTDFNEFASIWATGETVTGPKDTQCLKPRPDTSEYCNLLIKSDIFKKCNEVLDPKQFLKLCDYDGCRSRNVQRATCNIIKSYADRCMALLDICLPWREAIGDRCPFRCPEDKVYMPCESGCFQSCDSLRNPCKAGRTEGCFCPPEMVLINNTCSKPQKCIPCDKEGHFVGDIWSPERCVISSCQLVKGNPTVVTDKVICKPCKKYLTPPDEENCCGVCYDEGCVDERGIVHLVGEKWYSVEDDCIVFTCLGPNKIDKVSEC